jgi:gamma-glutamyltranspeptidase/glutathione hydrolase
MTAPTPQRSSYRPPILARSHAISSGHYLATQAGMRMFQRGGNAIDAGVAAGICIDVLLPDLCNFGGVAPCMVYHAQSGDLVTISGLGPWGRSATLEHFVEHEGSEIPIGAKRSVVPGAPDAWLTALARYGKLTLAEILEPAIDLCERGFVVYPSLARNLARDRDALAEWPSAAAIFLTDQRAPEAGQLLRQPDLARTFQRLIAAEQSVSGRGRAAAIEAARDEFYRGEIGKQIAEFIQTAGGFVSEADLAEFHSDIEQPVSTSYHGVDVYACGPWCQGPVLPHALNIIEGRDVRELGHNSAEYIHLCAEALNLAFADREQYYGDPHFVDVPLQKLLSKDYAAQQLASVGAVTAFPPRELMAQPAPQADTSYVCAVDDEGNAFSATPSDGVGSTPIVPGFGLICSGRGSQSWLIPGHASALAPGKRPRLTPNPAMAFKDGRLLMPFGTPGADMQPQAMLQTFLNIVDFGMDVQHAIETPRFGVYSFPESFWPHTYRPGRLNLEGRIPQSIGEELAERGHDVEWWPEFARITGNVCAILVDQQRGTFAAGADMRAEAYANGW